MMRAGGRVPMTASTVHVTILRKDVEPRRRRHLIVSKYTFSNKMMQEA
jgi:hypothetical protein